MMNTEVKTKWLEALRSGEYTQTKNRLHTDVGYCCLGVLCDIAVKEGVIPEPTVITSRDEDADKVYLYADHAALLPPVVSNWAGIDAFGNYSLRTLTDDNDEGKPFTEIADIIEANF